MEYEVRNIRQDEWPLLEGFLYEAIHAPKGFEGVPLYRSVGFAHNANFLQLSL